LISEDRTIQFPTETGKGRFFARPHLPPAELPNEEYPFILTTGRTAHQWHTMTKTGNVPALNKLNPGPFVEINPEDATGLDLTDESLVEVASARGRAIYPARITDRIRPGCCFAPFHWNDRFGDDLAINAATSEAVDPISKQPEFKFCAVRLSKVAAATADDRTRAFGGETNGQMSFTADQQAFLRGFFRNLGGNVSMTYFPKEAPFTEQQREWLKVHLREWLSATSNE
jgi:predicted molibdopterin-dependent oxidoreductase YjgC